MMASSHIAKHCAVSGVQNCRLLGTYLHRRLFALQSVEKATIGILGLCSKGLARFERGLGHENGKCSIARSPDDVEQCAGVDAANHEEQIGRPAAGRNVGAGQVEKGPEQHQGPRPGQGSEERIVQYQGQNKRVCRLLDAACKHGWELLQDLLGRSSEKSTSLCLDLVLLRGRLDKDQTVEVELVVYNRLHHGTDAEIAGEEDGSFVEARAVAAKVGDPSQARAVVEGREIDWAKEEAGNAVPEERLVGAEAEERCL